MPSRSDELLPTRWSLLSRLKDWDDQDSWRQFFDTYWRLIYATAIKAGLTHTEAQEVVQETVISVAKKMGEFKADPASGSFKSWLLTLTRWRINDQLRKRRGSKAEHRPLQSDNSRTSTVERVPDPKVATLEAEWDREWEKNLAETAIERVKKRAKPEFFQIFDLLVHKQWSPLKVAQRLQINLAQVYYAKYKVSAMVKREVKRLEKEAI
jgi:RNA polymerase sigma-70 factor (ECF subfamily)